MGRRSPLQRSNSAIARALAVPVSKLEAGEGDANYLCHDNGCCVWRKEWVMSIGIASDWHASILFSSFSSVSSLPGTKDGDYIRVVSPEHTHSTRDDVSILEQWFPRNSPVGGEWIGVPQVGNDACRNEWVLLWRERDRRREGERGINIYIYMYIYICIYIYIYRVVQKTAQW